MNINDVRVGPIVGAVCSHGTDPGAQSGGASSC